MSAHKLRLLIKFSSLSVALSLFGLLLLLSVAQKIDPNQFLQFVNNNWRDVAFFLMGALLVLFEDKFLSSQPRQNKTRRWIAVLLFGMFCSLSAVANASTFGHVASAVWQGYFVALLVVLMAAVGLLEISENCRC